MLLSIDNGVFTKRFAGRWGVVFGTISLGACTAAPADTVDDEALLGRATSVFSALDAVPAETLNDPAVQLGQRLYWDVRLSANGRTSCASCHHAEAGGSDPRPFPTDARGLPTSRHSQSVFNAMQQQARLRWLGDRESGAHQAERSITGSMGFDDAEDIVPLLMDLGYEDAFSAAFATEAQPLTPATYGRAIQAYQETLVTPAAFDRYLAGNREALTNEQKLGMEVFMATGCAACHSGALLGGSTFQKFGMIRDYWTATGKTGEPDVGRFAVTGEERDRYVFRVPMLRNVARTAPYFHDGSVATLPEAVRVMASVQLDRSIGDEELRRIVAFLESLTGEVPVNYRAP
ncbi:MAG: cytochrome c peroxidase [Gemmatimonadota bacterium]